MRLSHLDAEVVISPSSPYKCTAEGEIAAKKSHKKMKSVGKTGGFRPIKDQNTKILLNFNGVFLRDFCSALNVTAPIKSVFDG